VNTGILGPIIEENNCDNKIISLHLCIFQKIPIKSSTIYVKTTGITWTSNLKIENGHVESKTLPQHLRNIPKSNFPILSVI
jgi:hypothetical protein